MNVSFDYRDRTIVVTGAAQGIGREVALLYRRCGARVVVIDRNATTLAESWGVGDDMVLPLDLDVADPPTVTAAIAHVLDWSGQIDALVNNAGITRDTVVWKMTDEQWQDVLAVHLTGTFNLTRAVIPAMRAAGRGRIVNVTSFTGLHGNIGQANYAAAKAGIIGFTKTVAKEVAGFGITVNAISPNADTAMVAAIPPAKKTEITAQVPMKRFADPAETAAAVAFLTSDEAAYITGVVLPIDGGLSM